MIAIQMFMFRMSFPRPVRSLVVTHYKERFRQISFLDKVDSPICDDLRGVAWDSSRALGSDEDGIEIMSLTRDDFPVVESAWLRRSTFTQMPFPIDRCLISSMRAKLLGDIRELLVDLGSERVDGIDVVVRARQYGCSRRRADGIGDVAVIE